jgi:hypothetical protein
MIEKLLEAYDHAICAGEPEECARQFMIWMNRVEAALAGANMVDEHKAWAEAQNSVYFFSEDSSFPAQAESMKALLIGIRDKLFRKDLFVAEARLNQLRALNPNTFDLSKLIEICIELNACYTSQCFLAVAALTRAALDHVPPIFGLSSFSQVANNYSGGTKSFRESMKHLDESARKIADAHLHSQIRQKEVLPNSTQVNCSHDIDVLLGEVVRILK